ncbi:MAG: fumarylacetoacetate hydrolase family protein [Gammaproteobacteria bacterium]|nr:fumarylacetoacetate hydrolase family protein [Gammaproteobacteria bacterium]
MNQFDTARVFCIGRNYAEHTKEMGAPKSSEPVVFMKPATSLVREGEPLVLPKDQGSVHHEMELVVAIGREGRDLLREQALDHVAGVTLGIDLTLRDLQAKLKQAGQPWERAKSFEGSAPIGTFIPWPAKFDIQGVEMRCSVNGALRQQGNTRDMLFPVAEIIAFLSRHWRLRSGDLIFTGTPAGVGPLVAGDRITVESLQIGDFSWNVV